MSSSSEIHGRLGHPVIDIDGHTAEYLPTLAPYIEGEGLALDHPSLRRMVPSAGGTDRSWHEQTPAEQGGHPHPEGAVVERSGPPVHRSGHRPVSRAAL